MGDLVWWARFIAAHDHEQGLSIEAFIAHDKRRYGRASGGELGQVPHGFPGPGAHGRAYSRLKERQIMALLRESKQGHPRRARVLFLSGIRRAESRRRSKREAISRLPGKASVFASPLIDWTGEDMRRYRSEHGIPESPAAALLHRSGECNCGAMSSADERGMLQALYPDWFAGIEDLEAEAQAAGVRWCRWGGYDIHGNRAGKITRREAGMLCESCESRQHGTASGSRRELLSGSRPGSCVGSSRPSSRPSSRCRRRSALIPGPVGDCAGFAGGEILYVRWGISVRSSTPQERASVLALAGVVGLLVLWRTVAPAVTHVAVDPGRVVADVLPVLVGIAAVGIAVVVARAVLVRRTLRSRVSVELLPSEAFDPQLEGVVRFASQLARTRRMVFGWLDRPASAVRFQLATGPDGLVHYTVEVPRRGLAALEAALGAYDQLEAHPEQPDTAAGEGEGAVVRSELALARSSALPLADVGLAPDPLQSFAAALLRTEAARGESVVVAVDLMPAAPYQRRRLRPPVAAGSRARSADARVRSW